MRYSLKSMKRFHNQVFKDIGIKMKGFVMNAQLLINTRSSIFIIKSFSLKIIKIIIFALKLKLKYFVVRLASFQTAVINDSKQQKY